MSLQTVSIVQNSEADRWSGRANSQLVVDKVRHGLIEVKQHFRLVDHFR